MRIELHKRFADWLETRRTPAHDRAGRAARLPPRTGRPYKNELGRPDSDLASGRWAACRHRPRSRRAWRLPCCGEPPRASARPDPADTTRCRARTRFRNGSLHKGRGEGRCDRRRRRAARAEVGDEADQLLARFGVVYHRSVFEGDVALDELEQLAQKALPLLEERKTTPASPTSGSCSATWVANSRGRYEDYEYAIEQTLHHARLAGRHSIGHVGVALVLGRCPRTRRSTRSTHACPTARIPGHCSVGRWLLTMLARCDEAAPILREQGDRLRELGAATVDGGLGEIAATRGDHEPPPSTSAATATCSRPADSGTTLGLRAACSAARSASWDATTKPTARPTRPRTCSQTRRRRTNRLAPGASPRRRPPRPPRPRRATRPRSRRDHRNNRLAHLARDALCDLAEDCTPQAAPTKASPPTPGPQALRKQAQPRPSRTGTQPAS